MNDVTVAVATIVPALSLGASGVALVETRSRSAGVLMTVTAIGAIGSALARLGGGDSVAQVLLVGTLLLPGAAAVMAYPRLNLRGAVEFCLWITVAAAGVIATVFAFDVGISGTFASITGLALMGHAWWVLETGGDEDREAMLWLTLAAVTVGVAFSLLALQFQSPGVVAGALVLVAVGPAMVIGVRRPGLADVRSLAGPRVKRGPA